MTAWYWCEHAVVDGRAASDVRIRVDQGSIAEVVTGGAGPDDERLAGLTIAGFANVHSHAFHRALRGRAQADRGTFWTWRDVMYQVAARLTPDNYHRLARAVFAEMTLAGMSAVGEFHYVHHQPGGAPYDDPNEMGAALAQAASDAGIRLTLLDTVYLHGGLDADGHAPLSPHQARFGDPTVDAWAARVDALRVEPHQRVGAAIHSVRAVDPAAMATVADWASDRDAPLHVHLSEQTAENDRCRARYGVSPTTLLGEAGALGPRTTAVHATHLAGTDVELLASSGSGVCLCPTTERDLGDGVGPSIELAAAGVPVGLGSDSHAVIDHLEEARAVEMDERLRLRRRGLHSASELLAMATGTGHGQLGWDDAGTIAVGARADLTTIDLGSVRTAGSPAELALEAALFGATAADVRSVVIDGEPIVADGTHLRVDVAAELATAIGGLLG